VHKRDLHQIHFMAWRKGMKSLYYCRSLSIARADAVSEKAVGPIAIEGVTKPEAAPISVGSNAADFEECLACQ
jgi:ribonucleoside-diphosphate reductase alpha chain